MEPIGLTLKNIKFNPFTGKNRGELMVVHKCLGCGRISPNRIAGDDNIHSIISILEQNQTFDLETISRLRSLGIELLTPKDKPEVLILLEGCNRFT